ncbi:XdhC/CoxI family protein [Alteromonas sediminis]|uniref:XdhC/CoxI family protein n=1 Tax=Alteromonas sediminis TaxID=2259342 RepID=A0A3N5Y3N4_9ALTE|nr:XdhC/CoxI family protein [Alteromonas sediminis]RPJ68677.1 XdhC/CoxI family protein [Alteromonas sediminis]
MSHSVKAMLNAWIKQKRACRWALAVIFKVEGHSYRKPGAMGLYSDEGEQLGLLSGGCLESDIRLLARKAIDLNVPLIKVYDGTDDTDLSFHLGCGGEVHIAILPLTEANQWLDLEALATVVSEHRAGEYHIQLPNRQKAYSASFVSPEQQHFNGVNHTVLSQDAKEQCLVVPIYQPPHLLIAGGGIDAVPVCNMATDLEWRVTVWDPRPHYAPEPHFESAEAIVRDSATALVEYCRQQGVSMVMIMSHNLKLDAQVVTMCNQLELTHVALLGPVRRRLDVLEEAGLAETDLRYSLHSPAGLDIGGELPHSIALSIIAQCHSAVFGKL